MTRLWFKDDQEVGARHIGVRFWIRVALTALGVVLLFGTVIFPDWIELVFRVDPDHGSGWLEWAIVAAAFALTLTFSVSARREWRRATSALISMPAAPDQI